MKKRLILLALGFTNLVYSQNIGMNSTGATPNNSAILDLNTGNTLTSPNGKGLLIPNISLTSITDATTVTSPATSLLVYNTATAGVNPNNVTPGYYYWNGAIWVRLQITASTAKDWNLLGNAGTTAGTNFIGTTDANDLVLKTNATENMRIANSTGNVGINTTAPTTKLQVNGPSTGAIKIVDGNQALGNVLTSDANGVGTWQNTGQLVLGVLPNSQTTSQTFSGINVYTYSGASITLTPGKWIIYCSGLIGNPGASSTNVQLRLSTSSASFVPPVSISNTVNPGFLKGNTLLSGQADYNFCTPQVITVAATTTFYVLAKDLVSGLGSYSMSQQVDGTTCLFALSSF